MSRALAYIGAGLDEHDEDRLWRLPALNVSLWGTGVNRPSDVSDSGEGERE
jgi:hypothetical protein